MTKVGVGALSGVVGFSVCLVIAAIARERAEDARYRVRAKEVADCEVRCHPHCPIVVTTAYRTDCWCDRGVYPATAATAKEQQP